jgi:hypothetical protein
MDVEFRTLLRRAETAIDESRRILSDANLRLMAAQFRVLETQGAIEEAGRAQIIAVLLQKRSGRLLGQAGARTGGVLEDQR